MCGISKLELGTQGGPTWARDPLIHNCTRPRGFVVAQFQNATFQWCNNRRDGVSNHSTVYSGADQRKHQSSASLSFVRGIIGDRWISRTNGQERVKCFNLMTLSCISFFVASKQVATCHPQSCLLSSYILIPVPNDNMFKWTSNFFLQTHP